MLGWSTVVENRLAELGPVRRQAAVLGCAGVIGFALVGAIGRTPLPSLFARGWASLVPSPRAEHQAPVPAQTPDKPTLSVDGSKGAGASPPTGASRARRHNVTPSRGLTPRPDAAPAATAPPAVAAGPHAAPPAPTAPTPGPAVTGGSTPPVSTSKPPAAVSTDDGSIGVTVDPGDGPSAGVTVPVPSGPSDIETPSASVPPVTTPVGPTPPLTIPSLTLPSLGGP
jgi:hypothetical protein